MSSGTPTGCGPWHSWHIPILVREVILVEIAIQGLFLVHLTVIWQAVVFRTTVIPRGIPAGVVWAVATAQWFLMCFHVNTVSHIDVFEPCGIVADKPVLS
jgi:hypothetical protein